MLIRLEVKNFALIEDVSLEFSAGLNVLTGETGAGKSILLGAIKLLLGDRAFTDNIRTGYKESFIQGIFLVKDNAAVLSELKSLGIADSEIIISREINHQGRNICRLNGIIVPLAVLKKIGQHIIDLHGQHEHQSLLDPGKHIEVLDVLCGEELFVLKEGLGASYRDLQKIKKQIIDLSLDEKERLHRLDLYDFQLREIDAACLKKGEEEALKRRLNFLNNAEKIIKLSFDAYNELTVSSSYPCITDRTQGVVAFLSELSSLDDTLGEIQEQMVSAAEIMQDVARQLRSFGESIDLDTNEKADVEKRVEEINRLKVKYGNSIAEILNYASKVELEKEGLEAREEKINDLKLAEKKLGQEAAELAQKISKIRSEKSKKIATEVKKHLEQLSLQDAVFEVNFTAKKLDKSGCDSVEFFFSANQGEPAKSLQKIVSGGEMSRVMLALKSVLAEQQWIPTLVFDELDSGIGGKTVQFVGEKMLNISVQHQVICITHWPQIAALADTHFQIKKETIGNRTVTSVQYIDNASIVTEIARMLDGGEKGSLVQAKNILKRARKTKNNK